MWSGNEARAEHTLKEKPSYEHCLRFLYFTVRGGGFSNTQHCVYSLSDVDVMYVPLLRFLGPYIL